MLRFHRHVRKRLHAGKHDDAALKSRFGSIVKTYRQRLGLSQEELAWRAEMHRTYLADIERGRRNISLSRIVRLVKALRITLAEFFFAYEEFSQSPIETPPPPKPGGSIRVPQPNPTRPRPSRAAGRR